MVVSNTTSNALFSIPINISKKRRQESKTSTRKGVSKTTKQPNNPSQNTKTLRRAPNLPHPLRALVLHLFQANAQRRDESQVHTGRHRHLIRLLTEQQFTGVEQLAPDHGDDGSCAFIHDLTAGVEEVALQLEDGGLACGRVGDGCCGFGAEDCMGDKVLMPVSQGKRSGKEKTKERKEPKADKNRGNTRE